LIATVSKELLQEGIHPDSVDISRMPTSRSWMLAGWIIAWGSKLFAS
jgi:hypothetical protein